MDRFLGFWKSNLKNITLYNVIRILKVQYEFNPDLTQENNKQIKSFSFYVVGLHCLLWIFVFKLLTLNHFSVIYTVDILIFKVFEYQNEKYSPLLLICWFRKTVFLFAFSEFWDN